MGVVLIGEITRHTLLRIIKLNRRKINVIICWINIIKIRWKIQ